MTNDINDSEEIDNGNEAWNEMTNVMTKPVMTMKKRNDNDNDDGNDEQW